MKKALFAFALFSSVVLAQENPCTVKVSNGNKVFLAGGNAYALFEKYLNEAKSKGIKVNLRNLEVVYWDGRVQKTIKPQWGQIFSGEPISSWWKAQLSNVEAKYDQKNLMLAHQYGWDVVCINPTLPATSKDQKPQEQPKAKKGECSTEAQNHINLGISFINNKQVDNAIKEFEEAVKLSPTCPLAYANLASAHLVKNNINKAKDMYLKGVEQAGDDGFLHVVGAVIYTKRKEYDYALSALEKALKAGYKDISVLESKDLKPLMYARKKDFCDLMISHSIPLKPCLR